MNKQENLKKKYGITDEELKRAVDQIKPYSRKRYGFPWGTDRHSHQKNFRSYRAPEKS